MRRDQYDPIFLRCRREAAVVLGIFFASLVYTVGVAYLLGYGRPPEDLPMILGMPAWAVFGVFLPWLLLLPVTAWLSFRFLRDADLGEEEGGEEDGTGTECSAPGPRLPTTREDEEG